MIVGTAFSMSMFNHKGEFWPNSCQLWKQKDAALIVATIYLFFHKMILEVWMGFFLFLVVFRLILITRDKTVLFMAQCVWGVEASGFSECPLLADDIRY